MKTTMSPITDLSALLRGMYWTPRQLALSIWVDDEERVQRMTLEFEVKRAERRYAASYGRRTR